MKDLALKQNKKLHDFYSDASYQKMNHIILSTSTLSSPAVQIGGFCPVVPDGYGIGKALVWVVSVTGAFADHSNISSLMWLRRSFKLIKAISMSNYLSNL